VRAKGQFHILKEESISFQSQLNSVFLSEELNSSKILKKVFVLNKVNSKNQLNKLRQIKIPSPLKQKSCNYSRSQSGLVIFKTLISKEDQRKNELKLKKGSCNYYKVYQNYITKKQETPLSSILYSIFLTPVWEKNGLINSVKRINGINDNKDLEKRTNLFIPRISTSKGCNYYETPNGKVLPLKLILSSQEKEEFAVAFRCAQPIGLAKKKVKNKEPHTPIPPPEEKKIVHFFEIHAVSNIMYEKSDVSDVEVDIVSAYGIGLNYHYIIGPKTRINLNTQLEYYSEVKNRELSNNFTWKKNLNYEYLLSKSNQFGVTAGLYEQWYFDNIEVDIFSFTSSLLPYAGLTYHTSIYKIFQFDSEFGLFPSLDILQKEKVKQGAFSYSTIKFPIYGYRASLGLNIDYTVYERSTARNISLIGGLSFSY
jgi:hypothetical protein